MSNDASAIILAGGASRRMGQPKAALRFGDTTILERLIAELAGSFDELIVVAAPVGVLPDTVGELVARLRARTALIRDQAPFAGPALALVRGLRAAHHATAFVCSCDLPLLRRAVALALCATIDGFDAVIPEIAGRAQPLCAAYRPAAAARIEAITKTGEARLTAIVAELRFRRVTETMLRPIDPDLRSFLNVNTPDDYHRALKFAGL